MKKNRLKCIIAAFIIAGSIGAMPVQAVVVQQATTTIGAFQVVQPKDAPLKVPVNGAGMYLVGKDIKAGEYLVLINGDTPAYFEVSKDSKGNADSIVANGNVSTHAYITVADGQYFKVDRGVFLSPERVVLQTPSNGIYTQGTYRVGIDIPAGEYQVTSSGGLCYVEVAKDSMRSLESIQSNNNFETSMYVTVKAGQYLRVDGGQFAANKKETVGQGLIYWTSNGKSYHFIKDCVSLKSVKTIKQGSVEQAVMAGKSDACNLCADGTGTNAVVSTGTAPASTKSSSTQNYSTVTPKAPTNTSTTSSKESTVQKATAPEEQVVYWGVTGNKYHRYSNCRSFKGNTPNSGSIDDAIAAGRDGWCGICSK